MLRHVVPSSGVGHTEQYTELDERDNRDRHMHPDALYCCGEHRAQDIDHNPAHRMCEPDFHQVPKKENMETQPVDEITAFNVESRCRFCLQPDDNNAADGLLWHYGAVVLHARCTRAWEAKMALP